MGVVAYKKFFNVDVKHDFNKSGFTKDITITPTMETELLMRNLKLVQRATPGGMRVFYRAVGSGIGDTDPYVPFDASTMVFSLRLSNVAEFLNVTDLTQTNLTPDKVFGPGNILRFWNSPTNTLLLNYEILDLLRPAAFVFNFSLAAPATGNVQVEVKDAGGATVIPISAALTAVNGVYSYKIDLSEEPKGKYQLVVTDDGNVNNNKTVLAYIDDDLSGQDIFGILEISTPASTPSGTFATFVGLDSFGMQFTRRLTRWKYFVINKTKNIASFTTAAFAITDTQLLPYDPVYAGSPYAFGAKVVETPINGMETISIASVATIPFFEDSMPNFKLAVGASTLVHHLPNPSRQVVSSDPTNTITYIYVYV